MPKFEVGDRVKITYHTDTRFVGLEGEISEVRNTLGATTQGLPASGRLPDPGSEFHYTVRLTSGNELTDIRADWIEAISQA